MFFVLKTQETPVLTILTKGDEKDSFYLLRWKGDVWIALEAIR
jgi:hypothetical protein